MSELSNALRQRLGSGEEPRVHPDADTMAAYVERLLAPPERAQILEHLAVCRQCREVMALSLPEESIAEGRLVPTPAPARHGWRSWRPAWGLAASLAGLAVLAAVIIELPRGSMPKQSGQPAVSSPANTRPTVALAQPETAAAQPATPAPPAVEREAGTRTGFSGGGPTGASPAASAVTTLVSAPKRREDAGAAEPYVNVQMFSSDGANILAPPVDLPSAPTPRGFADRGPNLVVLNGAARLTPEDLSRETQSGHGQQILTPSTSSSHFGFSMVKTLGRDAKQLLFQRPAPAIRANAFSTSAMGGAGQFNPTREPGTIPELTSAAPLVGKDAVDLEQSRAFTARALAESNAGKMEAAGVEDRARRAAGVQPVWKVSDGKLLKRSDSGGWTQAADDEGIEFSVVSSHGADIWAGGSNAALVHSRDGGATWERITLGASASGTITSIEASGVKVLVKSSSGQSWLSPDGGKTWALQD